jgi:hypothetical protein
VLFHIIEVLTFRTSLILRRNAKITKHINQILLSFNGNVKELYENIIQKIENEAWYWNDDMLNEALNSPLYGKVSEHIIQYMLQIYENSISNDKFPLLHNRSIEHISPETIKNDLQAYDDYGYDVTKQGRYSVRFESKYLHSIGNLVISTGKQNSVLSNKSFEEKLEIYNNWYKLKTFTEKHQTFKLNQQIEIKNFVKGKKVKWGEDEIKRRGEKIVNFALKEWSLKIKL